MMARSAALNPSSLPFFPAGMVSDSSEQPDARSGLGFRIPPTDKHREPSGASSTVYSTTDFHSASSSPSGFVPTTHNGVHAGSRSGSPGSTNRYHQSGDADKDVHDMPTSVQSAPGGEPVNVSSSRAFNGEETAVAPRAIHRWVMKAQAPINHGNETVDFTTSTPELLQDRHLSQSALSASNRSLTNSTYPYNTPFKSASPVSSVGSASINTSSIDYSALNFESQIKSSPTIRDLLERLARCEFSNREIQRELAEMHAKVNFLVERSLGSPSVEPEFKNPFAPVNSASRSLTPALGLGPLQSATPPVGSNPTSKPDEIIQLSNRINSLTTVGQLLAIQTQQQIVGVQQSLGQVAGAGPLSTNADIAPNQTVPPQNIPNAGLLGHGLPNRPDLRPSPRVPNPPMRTWSAGTLELPMRPPDMNMGRVDSLPRDKRRSVANLMRRDSAGISDSPHDQWMTQGGSTREPGPVATRWEHLPIAPELLRSLNKLGIGPPNKIQQRALPFLLRGADIIAQAPPTQERIAAYVIPAIHVAVTHMNQRGLNQGPFVVLISTTVDQATQAQRIIRDLGTSIGIRSALGVGSVSPNSDVSQELRLFQQSMPHIMCGTPQKLHALFTAPGGLSGSEVRFLVLDEVDQLIARNLHEFVFNIVKLLPPPRSRGIGASGPIPTPTSAQVNPLEQSGLGTSPLSQTVGRRLSALNVGGPTEVAVPTSANLPQVERQTALFSNTVPQDVLNLANFIQLREPVRVLVRRDGNVTHSDTNQGTKGLRQFYLYLAFTASGARPEPSALNAGGGHGIIGSGRTTASSAEANQAREWKLDALADLLDDLELSYIIVHVGGLTALDAVVYKLVSKGFEAIPLHNDMNAGAKLAALNKFRNAAGSMLRRPATKVLVVYDVQIKAPDVYQVPLVINYDLPQAVEEYALRVAPAIANNYSKAGVVVNFVTATGGDVEMLRSIECFYKIKCPEVPVSLRDLF